MKKTLRQLVHQLSGLGKARLLTEQLLEGRLDLTGQDALKQILEFAKTETDYYAQNGGEVDDLDSWPILTKEIIGTHFKELQSHQIRKGRYQNSSGGSTGNPTTLIQDLEYRIWGHATLDYYFRQFLDVEQYDVPHVILWGSERDTMRQKDLPQQVYSWLTNTVFLNSFAVTPARWKQYVEIINRVKPVYIKGYTSSLYELALYVQKNGQLTHKPKFLYSTAETLFPHIRQTLEEVFGCKVYNFYGSREVGTTAGECREGNVHIFTFNNIVEIESGKASTEVGGRVLVTNLHNYSLPVIRYEIGDTAILGKHKCACGSKLPMIAKITGRIADHFRKRDGTMIYGDFFSHLLYGKLWIKQFQVLQYDFNQFTIKVVTFGKEPEQAELAEINKRVDHLMEEKCDVTWDFVKQIETTPQGKHLYTRCLIDKSKLKFDHV